MFLFFGQISPFALAPTSKRMCTLGMCLLHLRICVANFAAPVSGKASAARPPALNFVCFSDFPVAN